MGFHDSAFQEIIADLHEATAASRTTLRINQPGAFFPVVTEAVAAGVASIAQETAMDLRRAETYGFLERELRPLVQSDCVGTQPAPPQELIDVYGVRAQMLAPIVGDETLIGIISVHDTRGPRDWSEDDLAALHHAAHRVTELLAGIRHTEGE